MWRTCSTGVRSQSAKVAVWLGQLRDREPVGRVLAEDREHQPFR
jgi:hypothetical protein